MAAHKQPDSPAQNSKYSINVDNCTIDKLVMGDYNTVNDNRSGRSRPSSQESSPILDSGESPFTKGKRVCLDNSSRDNGEDTVSGKRDHRSQQPKNGSYPIGQHDFGIWTISHETMVRILFLGNEITGHSNRRTDLTQFGASYRYCKICF